jgi:hypothetical protein
MYARKRLSQSNYIVLSKALSLGDLLIKGWIFASLWWACRRKIQAIDPRMPWILKNNLLSLEK